MTKEQLVEQLQETLGGTLSDARIAFETMLGVFAKAIRSEKRLSLAGFGTFTVRTRRARMGVNPQTKKPIKIPSSRTVTFKPSKSFKKTL